MSGEPGALSAIKAHPFITAFVVICTVAGGVAGLYLPFEDWGLARRIIAGAVGGFGCGLIIVTTRLVGAFGDEPEDEPTRSGDDPQSR